MHALTFLMALAGTALANPIAAPSPDATDGMPRIVRRGEGVHLVNCVNYSAVVYCANDSNCNFFPGSGNQCIPNAGLTTWEGGKERQCIFPGTNTVFKWNIDPNAQSFKTYSRVGSGNNGFHDFAIYKDDQHVMYKDGNGNSCKSIYYCLP